MTYDPDAPKTAEELALEEVVNELAYRLHQARLGSAEYRMIERQVAGVKRGSQLGRLIVEEYEMSALL
jgi:hypothetical protein